MPVHMLFAALITSILFAGGDYLWKTVQKVLYTTGKPKYRLSMH